jgi:flagellar basal-body rod modification protein FlgD
MSSIGTTPSTSQTSGAGATTPSNPSSTLNESDFLQLLVAQLQNQDPTNPTSSDTFIQEQAQFSTVEGITNMESTLTAMNTAQQLSSAESLIGMNVEYTVAGGSPTSGTVTSASNNNGDITVQVGGVNVDPSTITQVSFPSSASSTSSTGSSSTTTSGSGTGG